MAYNKGIITAFSLLVGCGFIAAASLLYMKNDPYEMKYKDEKKEAINTVKKYEKEIKEINEIFKNFKSEDSEDEEYKKFTQKKIIKRLVDGEITYNDAIIQAKKYVYNTDDEDETHSGGKRTKRHKKLKSKTKSKKFKSKSKIYKKLI
jgi:hypothetical protein